MPKRNVTVVESSDSPDLEKISENVQGNTSDLMSAKSLREIIFLGRLTEEVSISGFNFKLTTLSGSEQRSVIKSIMSAEEDDRILSAKAIAIAHSLRSINSIPLSEASSSSDGDSDLRRSINFVFDMQSSLVDRLYSVYESLAKRSGEEVGLDELKK